MNAVKIIDVSIDAATVDAINQINVSDYGCIFRNSWGGTISFFVISGGIIFYLGIQPDALNIVELPEQKAEEKGDNSTLLKTIAIMSGQKYKEVCND